MQITHIAASHVPGLVQLAGGWSNWYRPGQQAGAALTVLMSSTLTLSSAGLGAFWATVQSCNHLLAATVTPDVTSSLP